METLKKHFAFMAALMILVGGLGVMIWQQERILNGQTIILETRPVDPRDLFRGEYVVLRYAIEADEEVVRVARGLPAGASLYVELQSNDANRGIGEVIGVSGRPAGRELAEGVVVLRGEVRTLWNDEKEVRFPDLEQFYVPEGAGTPIEVLGREDQQTLYVEVAVRDGVGRVLRLLTSDLTPITPADYLE